MVALHRHRDNIVASIGFAGQNVTYEPSFASHLNKSLTGMPLPWLISNTEIDCFHDKYQPWFGLTSPEEVSQFANTKTAIDRALTDYSVITEIKALMVEHGKTPSRLATRRSYAAEFESSVGGALLDNRAKVADKMLLIWEIYAEVHRMIPKPREIHRLLRVVRQLCPDPSSTSSPFSSPADSGSDSESADGRAQTPTIRTGVGLRGRHETPVPLESNRGFQICLAFFQLWLRTQQFRLNLRHHDDHGIPVKMGLGSVWDSVKKQLEAEKLHPDCHWQQIWLEINHGTTNRPYMLPFEFAHTCGLVDYASKLEWYVYGKGAESLKKKQSAEPKKLLFGDLIDIMAADDTIEDSQGLAQDIQIALKALCLQDHLSSKPPKSNL